MKTFQKLYLLLTAVTLLTACSDDPKYNKIVKEAPVIHSFSPAEGKSGTEVKIEGEHLQYVDTVYIGGGLATLKYRISPTELVVKVNSKTRTGNVVVQNSVGKNESHTTFTVLYAIPAFTKLPSEGTVNSQILIEGNNLETVKEILFGTVPATIISQNENELVVTIPYVEEDNVTIYLTYNTESGESRVSSSNTFKVVKTQLVIDSYPTSGITGEEIALEGNNLSIIEKITFGTVEATLRLESEERLVVLIPFFETTTTVPLHVHFYGGYSTLVEEFEVIVPDPPHLMYWKNKKLYCQNVNLTDNFFNGDTGEIYTPCEYQDVKQYIDFFISWGNSAATFSLNNPNNSANQTKAFKCDGNALPEELMPNVVLFRVLSMDNPAHARYIQAVKEETLEELSIEELTEEGLIAFDASGLLSGTNAPRYEGASNSFTTGDILLAMKATSDKKQVVKVGMIHVLGAVLDGTSSSMTFNCYWQN